MFFDSDLYVFIAALVTVYLLPGPDMAMVISTSSMSGERNGLLVALGLAFSRAFHVTLSAIGLATAFQTHPVLFDIVRWFGAGYFIWIAWKILQSNKDRSTQTKIETHTGLAALQRGFLTNLLNPKAFMFCALLLPQFISTNDPLIPQYLLLGSILVGIGAMFDVIYAVMSYRLAQGSSGSTRVQTVAKFIFAGVFILAALRLVISGI